MGAENRTEEMVTAGLAGGEVVTTAALPAECDNKAHVSLRLLIRFQIWLQYHGSICNIERLSKGAKALGFFFLKMLHVLAK